MNQILNENILSTKLGLDALLEISKTAQLLSNQLLGLHRSLAMGENKFFAVTQSTPASSGYCSINASYENICLNSNKKLSRKLDSSQTDTSLTSSSPDTSCSLKRSLFSSASLSRSVSTSSLLEPPPESASKKQKMSTSYSKSKSIPITPHKNQTIAAPAIPKIKEIRKKMNKMSGKEKLKLRLIYNDLLEN